ncbi:hypothetical protein Aasi_0846 [Candidatus Amoebophilus asiaticus 5a2]|uniref:Uncharacterized protein n=1 Tax=Amoebophilus asiaticus (strain 5a2) TaxID=452471 RepID=B3ESL5_AMOA5|nr:hypothetical protein [Candidatus Amoebophilus asiaticus]ACE06217.1 hypothetical protein Aasi_0846 [Candidatus Amoebophilus asiaticus 5a2]
MKNINALADLPSSKHSLNELEKLSVQVEAALDKERYNAVVGEIKQVLDTRIETINRLQEEEADPVIIIATAREIKPHVEAAIKHLEEFSTKQDKSSSIENLKEAKSQLEGVIRDYTHRKVLWDKYKSAFSYAAKHVSKRIEQEQEELAKSIGKSVEKPEITITNKSGITIAQLEEIFPEDSSNNFNLQKLIDTLDITVNFPAAEENANSSEEDEEEERQGVEEHLEREAKYEKTVSQKEEQERASSQAGINEKEKESAAKRQARKEQRRANQKARRKEASPKKAHEKELIKIGQAKEQLKSLVKDQVKSCVEDAEFTNCRVVLLMIDEKLKKEPNNKSLQALRVKQLEKFQSHPLYSQVIALGIEVMALCQQAELKADERHIRATILPHIILPLEINQSREFRQESEEIEATILNSLRDLLCCSHRPSGLRRTAEGIKGFVESFYDTGKLFLVDVPVLLDNLGMKGIESLVKWEDKLGMKQGWANLGEFCKKLFDETKQAWEDPEAYKARMQAAHEIKRREALYRRAFDAENYHLGQDK